MKKENITSSSVQTKKLGEKFTREILKNKPALRRGRPKKKAFVIGLEGKLGAGKTCFLQGFAKGLRVKEKILSPTFVILKKFRIKDKNFYHIDCYRIQKPKELLDLDFKEIISNSENIIAVEWADKIKKIMPKHALWIKFKFVNEKTRKITIKS
jgi:tRNA threonylcarbamoyladenosine biosynthesis protein TsaE